MPAGEGGVKYRATFQIRTPPWATREASLYAPAYIEAQRRALELAEPDEELIDLEED